MSGRLLLVPAPLDFGCEPPVPLTQVLPAGTEFEAGRDAWKLRCEK